VWVGRFAFLSTEYREATTDHAKHALSIDHTLITALFVIISLERHPTRIGLHLLMFIVRFRIRDNAHPLSRGWNFLKLLERCQCGFDDMPLVPLTQVRCLKEFIIFSINTFIGTFTTCSSLNIVFTFMQLCLSIVSCIRSSTILMSSKNRRDSI